MYTNLNVLSGRTTFNEIGVTIRPVSGPTMTGASDQAVFVYFWALDFYIMDSAGTDWGGGHLGVQWVQVGQTTHHGRINYGMYDYFYGAGNTSFACRGSLWPLERGFDNQNGDFYFPYGTTFKFRLAKSPKQNYTAAELDAGTGQSAPYVGTAQQSTETAYRMWMKVDSGPWFAARDCLVKNAPGDTYRPLHVVSLFTEYIPTSAGADAFPGHPKGLFRDLVLDGRSGFPSMVHTYPGGTTHNNITHVTVDSVGWVQHEADAALTRTTVDGTTLTNPSIFWDPGPANVSPTPSVDPAARVATPRPWY